MPQEDTGQLRPVGGLGVRAGVGQGDRPVGVVDMGGDNRTGPPAIATTWTVRRIGEAQWQ